MIVFVLGGSRSGKSQLAEQLTHRLQQLDPSQPVHYVATAIVDEGDADHRARVDVHQARRPPNWNTHECDPHVLAAVVRDLEGIVLIDALGSWLAAHDGVNADVDALTDALCQRHAPTIVVSDEVGLAVHAPTEVGRRFADALGACNQAVAEVADRVLFVAARRAIELRSFDEISELIVP